MFKFFRCYLIEKRTIKLVHNWRTRCHLKCAQLRTRGGGVKPHVYVCNCTISFHILAAFLS